MSGTILSTVFRDRELLTPKKPQLAATLVLGPSPSSSSPSSVTSSGTTQPSNSVTTPSPIQDGMVTNFKTFYFVNQDETWLTVTSENKITVEQLH
jgi:hypothetical protein